MPVPLSEAKNGLAFRLKHRFSELFFAAVQSLLGEIAVEEGGSVSRIEPDRLVEIAHREFIFASLQVGQATVGMRYH